MPKDKTEKPEPTIEDALVGAIHAAQTGRKALRGEVLHIAKRANDAAGRVLGALGDF